MAGVEMAAFCARPTGIVGRRRGCALVDVTLDGALTSHRAYFCQHHIFNTFSFRDNLLAVIQLFCHHEVSAA